MRTILIIIIGLLVFSGCEKKELDTGINPYDPDNPGYEAPSFVFTSAPQDGETIQTDSAVFIWQGNQPDILYSYRYKEERAAVWPEWSPWFKDTRLTLSYLDELTYQFELKAKYPGVGAAEGEVVARTFTINAVAGPSILYYPKKQTVNANQTFTITIMAEEVADLTMADFIIVFSKDLLHLTGQIAKGTLVDNAEDMLLLTKPDTYSEANANGQLNVSVGLLNQAKGYSGTAEICTVTFKALKKGSAILSISGNPSYRDYNNQDIAISVKGQAWVEIK